ADRDVAAGADIAAGDVGRSIVPDDADIDAAGKASHAGPGQGAVDDQHGHVIDGRDVHVLVGVGAGRIGVDLGAGVDVGAGIGIDHLDRDSSRSAEEQTAAARDHYRENVLAGSGGHGQAAHVVGAVGGAELARVVERAVEHRHGTGVALGIDDRVLPDPGLRVLADLGDGDAGAHAADAQADADAAGDDIDVGGVNGADENISPRPRHRIGVEIGVGRITHDQHRHRAGDGHVARAGDGDDDG